MTYIRISHPLNRWAPVSDEQSRKCVPWAKIIAHADSLPLAEVADAVIAFTIAVRETISAAHTRSPEAATIEWLSWRKAMAGELKRHKHRRPLATTDQVLTIGMRLHYSPARFRKPSTLLEIVNEYGNTITLDHLTRLASILNDYDSDAESAHEIWESNRRLAKLLIGQAQSDGLSPKQLEIFICKLTGTTPAGRPRKEI